MLNRRNFWIGYSSLQLSLGRCFLEQFCESQSDIVLIRKTSRYSFSFIGGKRVHHYNPLLAAILFLYLILTRSTLWVPGLSPTSCSTIEKFAFRLLFKTGQLRFSDDGLAGFVPNTYTWYHTSKIIPQSQGNVSWDQQARSPLFTNSQAVHVELLKSIESGINLNLLIKDKTYSIFIEANAMNIELLYISFLQSIASNEHNFYFAHTDKGSVAGQFVNQIPSHELGESYHRFFSHQYKMLESYLMHMLDRSLSLLIFSGCTSTVLILLHYASKSGQLYKLRFYYSPEYSRLHPEKIAQTQSFYQYLKTYFPSSCHMLS
jgi:hypothetical protein